MGNLIIDEFHKRSKMLKCLCIFFATFNSTFKLAVLKKIWLLFGKNSTALDWPHLKNHIKAEKHVKRTTVKFDFFYNYSESSVSQSFLITYRKYSEFIQKDGMLQCFSKMAQPFSIHGWIDNFWLLLLCSHSKKADENYVALCDIDETISCSKVFTSKYGKGSNLKYYIF